MTDGQASRSYIDVAELLISFIPATMFGIAKENPKQRSVQWKRIIYQRYEGRMVPNCGCQHCALESNLEEVSVQQRLVRLRTQER